MKDVFFHFFSPRFGVRAYDIDFIQGSPFSRATVLLRFPWGGWPPLVLTWKVNARFPVNLAAIERRVDSHSTESWERLTSVRSSGTSGRLGLHRLCMKTLPFSGGRLLLHVHRFQMMMLAGFMLELMSPEFVPPMV